MISIIISTHNAANFKNVSQNIADTIGVPYEIVPVENHAKYSLCTAYNLGANMAKFSYLCFLHEDVLFKTPNWGKQLTELMEKDEKTGLIGVMGTKFKSTFPKFSWGNGYFLRKMYRGHIVLPDGKCKNYGLKYREIEQYNTIQYNTIQ